MGRDALSIRLSASRQSAAMAIAAVAQAHGIDPGRVLDMTAQEFIREARRMRQDGGV